MIAVLLAAGGCLLAAIAWDVRRLKRRQRERDEMRHIVGARPWWGQR
jgi:hypothetical protein